jgi:hypothetical protein
LPSRQRRRTRRPETAAPRSRTCRCEARGLCVRARAHTSVCFPLFLSLSLARWRARYLVLSLSFPLSRSHYRLRACVRACVHVGAPSSSRAWPYEPIWACARDRFSGRSNVGKSSLLNAVCSIHGLARTSKVPWMSLMLSIFFVKFLNYVSS